MDENQVFIEGIKALAQIGVSGVFILAWYKERQTNEKIVDKYMLLREKALELETEKVKLEFAELTREDTRKRLTKTEIPETH